MATIIVDVQDKKLKFFKELINQLSFVKIREDEPGVDSPGLSEGPLRCTGTPVGAVDSPEEDTDEQVIANIREGVRQMRLVEQGKMKSRPAREFLKEL